ncbi:MAG TPA: HTTM domain-containing protein [Oculatellaceae cyanobacterium]
MNVNSLQNIWNRLWFSQVSTASLCIFRIIFGFLVFASSLLLAPDITHFFGGNPIISIATIKAWSPNSFSLFFLLPPSDLTAISVYSALLIASLCLCLGFHSRTSAIVTFVCLVSFHNRLPCIFNGADMLLRQQAFLLMLAPSGSMYSLDERQNTKHRGDSGIIHSAWPLVLLQLQLASVYCQAFWTKALCPEWWDGRAIYYAGHLIEYSRIQMPAICNNLEFCRCLGWGTLAIELALWTLIWFKPARYFVLALGILLHGGIESVMSIGLFSYTMIASYALFIDPQTIESVMRKILAKRSSFVSSFAGAGRLIGPVQMPFYNYSKFTLAKRVVSKLPERNTPSS